MRSAAFEVDEYRLMSGWPVVVPSCDIAVPVLVSGAGLALDNRDSPTALTTNADLRWVADDSYYDQVSLLWRSIQGNSTWASGPTNAPVLLSDYAYRVGDEMFTDMTVLNFDSDTASYLTNDLSLLMGGTSGYTVVMVLSPNSFYGNDPNVVSNGLWGPDSTDGSWAAFMVSDQRVWMVTEVYTGQPGVAIGDGLNSSAPTYLALVVNRPQTTLYAGPGPRNVAMRSLVAGARPEPLSTRFWLGNAALPGVGTMDMALFDIGIYANPLSKSQVVSEFALLSQIYGGDS